MPDRPPLYPLTFTPIYKQKVWGGRTLSRLGRDLPGDENTPIGESWELADLGRTAASGGGGGAERSVVAHGPLKGSTLHELIRAYGRELVGDLPMNHVQTPEDASRNADSSEGGGEFPLLLKFLDARENLSVQVHPNQAYAAKHAGAFLKSEAWYVVHTEPDAVIYKGVKEGVTPQRFREAIEDNAVQPLLNEVPVRPGDCHYLPSGTCHALGAGVMVAEVQTPSDTTFRVYDWGRTGRELHVEQAMACIHFGPPDISENELHQRIERDDSAVTRLVACEYFRIDKIEAGARFDDDLTNRQPVLWMVLEGGGTLVSATGAEVPLTPGQTLLLPADHHGGRMHLDHDTTWLEITFPHASPHRIA